MVRNDAPFNLVMLALGFVIWSVAFGVLYSVFSIGCEFGWHEMELGFLTVQRAVLLALWAVHLLAMGLLLLWAWRRYKRQGDTDDSRSLPGFFKLTVFGTMLSAAFSTAWVFSPILGLSACL